MAWARELELIWQERKFTIVDLKQTKNTAVLISTEINFSNKYEQLPRSEFIGPKNKGARLPRFTNDKLPKFQYKFPPVKRLLWWNTHTVYLLDFIIQWSSQNSLSKVYKWLTLASWSFSKCIVLTYWHFDFTEKKMRGKLFT